jgi:hypothetical protein
VLVVLLLDDDDDDADGRRVDRRTAKSVGPGSLYWETLMATNGQSRGRERGDGQRRVMQARRSDEQQ